MANRTGLMWSLGPAGLRELVRSVSNGTHNPSLIFRVHARNTPDRAAIVWRDRVLTWAELDRDIDALAAVLRSRGVARGRRMVLMSKNRPECVAVGAACARIGAAVVTAPWRSTAEELSYLVNDSGAVALVLEPEFAHVLVGPDLPSVVRDNTLAIGDVAPPGTVALGPLLASTPPLQPNDTEASDDDAALVIYTSGTTGKPKGAVRKFPKDTATAAFRFIAETPMRVDDVHLVATPLYHSTAFGFLTLAHLIGSTAVIMDEFRPETFLAMVEEHRVTTTAVVPTLLHRILELPASVRRKYDTRSLTAVFTGGAPLPVPLGLEFMDVFGDVVYVFYGATETGLVTLATPRDLREAPGTIGRAVPGNEIRLLDDERRDVAQGAVGELFVKNQLSVIGYHHDPAATKESIHEGYFSVGDLARADAEGRYFIEGRKRDLIITGGTNVYPAEVEAVLERHPDVDEVAVVGVPDREWGERIRACVVRRKGSWVDEGTLITYTREHLASFKAPREVVFLESLPRNPTGKVVKRDLR